MEVSRIIQSSMSRHRHAEVSLLKRVNRTVNDVGLACSKWRSGNHVSVGGNIFSNSTISIGSMGDSNGLVIFRGVIKIP
jgi:hypothetical protein